VDKTFIALTAFWCFGLIFTALEVIRPARPIKYREFVMYDLGAVVKIKPKQQKAVRAMKVLSTSDFRIWQRFGLSN